MFPACLFIIISLHYFHINPSIDRPNTMAAWLDSSSKRLWLCLRPSERRTLVFLVTATDSWDNETLKKSQEKIATESWWLENMEKRLFQFGRQYWFQGGYLSKSLAWFSSRQTASSVWTNCFILQAASSAKSSSDMSSFSDLQGAPNCITWEIGCMYKVCSNTAPSISQ